MEIVTYFTLRNAHHLSILYQTSHFVYNAEKQSCFVFTEFQRRELYKRITINLTLLF